MDQTERHAKLATYAQMDVFEKIKRLIDFEKCGKLRVLDVGCGQGALDDHLRSLGHEVVGLDIHEDLELAPPNYVRCDINKPWPVDGKSFDLVTCTDVPEHMYDPLHVLNESGRVLKTDGRLIFGVPNHFDLRQRLRMLFGKGIVHWDGLRHGSDAWDFPHIRFFVLGDLDRKFPRCGWRILRHQFNFMGCGLIPSFFKPFNAFLLRMRPGIFSGKFVVLACRVGERSGETAEKDIYVPRTLSGM